MDNEYLTRPEAAKLLHVTPQTLANWKWKGFGPMPTRPSGGKTLYRRRDIEQFLRSQG